MRTGLCATAIALTLIATTTPAQAESHGHAIRYVSLNKCETGGPCGPWRITLGDGHTYRFPDARVHPLNKRGKPIKKGMAPIGVSGNGLRVAYLRADNGRVIVRDLGGAAHEIADTGRVDNLWLSLDGARLAVGHGAGVRLYEVATGAHLGTLPRSEEFLGFSGDGGEVLTLSGEHTLHSRTLSGHELARSKVNSDGPFALNADGVTVAWLTTRSGKGRAVLWDLAGDRPNVRTWVRIPNYQGAIQQVEMLDWTADTQLTLHVRDDAMRTPAGMHVLLLDLGTSRFTVRDRYTVRSKAHGFEACGG